MKKIIFNLTLFSSYLFGDINIYLDTIINQSEEMTMWIALFGLGFIAILALFVSSEKIRRYKKEVDKVNRNKEDIYKQHNQILSNMGENIQTIAEENIDLAKRLSQTDGIDAINKDIHYIKNSEDKLLSIATNLIEFLRLKSKKVEILNEKLSFSNLLNDVSGTIKELIKETPFELHYNLKDKLKENIYADTLNLSKILVNIILYCVEHKASKVLLHISNTNAFSKSNKLYFTFSTNLKIDAENSDTIFSSHYDERTGTYDSLGLFVARELCQLMGGELIARNDTQGNLEFLFDIGYKEDTQSVDKPKIKKKKVLIVDRSDDAALCCKHIFESLEHQVIVMKAQDYLYTLPNFSQFDLIVLDEGLFTKAAMAKLTSADKSISLSNLFGPLNKKINTLPTNLSLQKPLTKKQVQELLENIYLADKKNNQTIDDTKASNILVYKKEFLDATEVSLPKFSKFRKSNILLVEDNFINQKVLLGILSKSGINIVIANNGQEALDKLSEDIKFDLVFMDINMPVMDGYTATKHIRKNTAYDELPIIALTALTSRLEIESMFDVGMNAYLAKPLRKEKLFSALSMFIENKEDDRRQSVRYEERVNKLPGLDVEVGIANSNDNDFFYQEILKEFQDAYNDSDEIFFKLVEDFRYEQLRMLCLDVRGLSASIGAEDMNQLCTEVLKLLLFKKYEILKDFVSLYAKSLERLNHSIDQYIPN